MDWKTISVAPEIIARYLSKGKTPPSKPKQEFVTRYHRTKANNAPSIEQHGLLTHNPNIGDNTWLPSKADYHKIWLADNPTEIPVLRDMMRKTPQDVTTYKVRMPKEWYMESPRFYMPKGRGNPSMKSAPADEVRLTDEGRYKIDLLGRDVPPKYLQKLPTYKASDQLADARSELYFNLFEDRGHDFNLSDPESVQKLPRRLRAEARALSKDLADNDYHYLTSGLAPSDEMIAATVSPVRVARGVIDRAKHDDIGYLAREGYPYTEAELREWTKSGIYNDLASGMYGTAPVDEGLPAIPQLKVAVDKYLDKYVSDADFGTVSLMSDWLNWSPTDLANEWIKTKLPAIKNNNTLASQDVLPVFSQIKHKLMLPDDRYKDWPYGSYGAYSPTDDIDFKAAATLLEALQRSNHRDLLPQARDILFNNLQYYK